MTWGGALTILVWAALMVALLWWCWRVGRAIRLGGSQGTAARNAAELNAAMGQRISAAERAAMMNMPEGERFRGGYGALSQSAKVRGAGSVVIQSGCIVGGDMVGGDLIKGSASAGRCKYCGAAQ